MQFIEHGIYHSSNIKSLSSSILIYHCKVIKYNIVPGEKLDSLNKILIKWCTNLLATWYWLIHMLPSNHPLGCLIPLRYSYTCASTFSVTLCTVANHSSCHISSPSSMGKDTSGSLKQLWHFCIFNQSWTAIFWFKLLPVLFHVPQAFIHFGFITISGNFIYFLLVNQTSF